MSDAPESRSPRGLAGDVHRARVGAKASAAELREYVQQFRGKSPQDMLGLVAGSSLVQSTALAAVLSVGFLAAFTVGPYMWDKWSAPVAKAATKSPAPPTEKRVAEPAQAAEAPQAPASGSAAVVTTPQTPAAPKVPPTTTGAGDVPAEPVLDRLGIGESKPADPTKNPLEAGTDDLLKDLK